MTDEANDPRVASIVRELRRLGPEHLAQVLAETKRMLGRVVYEARLDGDPQAYTELLEHRSWASRGAVDATIALERIVDLLALVGGEQVRVHVDVGRGVISFDPVHPFVASGFRVGATDVIRVGTPLVVDDDGRARPAHPPEAYTGVALGQPTTCAVERTVLRIQPVPPA